MPLPIVVAFIAARLAIVSSFHVGHVPPVLLPWVTHVYRVEKEATLNHRYLRHSLFASVQSTESASSPKSLAESRTVGNTDNVGSPVLVDAVICGGGPAGLLTAIMLAQQEHETRNHNHNTTLIGSQPRFATIHVYDRLEAPPGPDDATVWNDVARFYLIGLGGRGQRALRRFGLWDAVEQRCTAVVGRKDWTPESNEPTERIFGPERRTTTQVLPRDKLVGVLQEHIQTRYAKQITLHYGMEVQPVEFDSEIVKTDGQVVEAALLRVSKCTTGTLSAQTPRVNPTLASETTTPLNTNNDGSESDMVCDTDVTFVSTPLLVAADGAGRTIANTIANLEKDIIANPWWRPSKLVIQRYPDDNQRIYKTIPMKLPRDWRGNLNYSARTKRVNFDALPANANNDYCGVLLLRANDPMATADTDPNELRALLDETLPQFSTLLDDATVSAVAKKPVSFLPAFRYVSRLHKGATTVLLGDAAHQVKPYFGLGCNSALEDVVVLSEALAKHPTDIPHAVRLYSRKRSPEAKVLVKISRDLDRPGPLGVLMFVVPIVLDSIFAKLFPKFFLPNVITMLQNENYTFQRLARRKRVDRVVQVLLLSGVAVIAGLTAKTGVHALAALLGTQRKTVWSCVLCLVLGKPLLAKLRPKKLT